QRVSHISDRRSQCQPPHICQWWPRTHLRCQMLINLSAMFRVLFERKRKSFCFSLSENRRRCSILNAGFNSQNRLEGWVRLTSESPLITLILPAHLSFLTLVQANHYIWLAAAHAGG